VAVALQQLFAQPLPLQKLILPQELWLEGCLLLPVLNMSLLTKLTELDMRDCVLSKATVLPMQLQCLAVQSSEAADSLAPVTRLQLKQLEQLSLKVYCTELQPLLQLAQLPALQHLALRYEEYAVGSAAATASAWALMPQLQELAFCEISPRERQWAAILAGIAAAASLTKLQLNPCVVRAEPYRDSNGHLDLRPRPVQVVDAAVCASLTGLTRLKDLTISFNRYNAVLRFAPGDALALTALTSLTRLDLGWAARGVGTDAAAALAHSLKQLQHLSLAGCDLQLHTAGGMACLEAIGRLTQLTHLGLKGNQGLTHQGLMQLTGLKYLQQPVAVVESNGSVITVDSDSDNDSDSGSADGGVSDSDGGDCT
jgi:hypothetical protein